MRESEGSKNPRARRGEGMAHSNGGKPVASRLSPGHLCSGRHLTHLETRTEESDTCARPMRPKFPPLLGLG